MISLLIGAALAAPPSTDALRAELDRSATALELPGEPAPYYIQYQLWQASRTYARAHLGGIVRSSREPSRSLEVSVRVGDPALDNTNFGFPWEDDSITMTSLVDAPDAPWVDRQDAWRATDQAYKGALEGLARKEASRARAGESSQPPSFVPRAGVTVEADAAEAPPLAAVESLVQDLSAVFLDHPAIEWSTAEASGWGGQRVILDTEGSHVRATVDNITVSVVAVSRAADGMLVTDRLLWVANGAEGLPPTAELLAATEAMAARLTAWQDATAAEDEYVGPVIFEDAGAVALFQQLLVPGMGGTPAAEQPLSDISMVFGDDRGTPALPMRRRVLPPGWSVVDDAASRPELAASAPYDTEGSPVKPVTVIEDGVVRALLMSRTPSRYSSESTGHARGSSGQTRRALASVVEISPGKRVSQRRMVSQAHKLSRTYDLDHVLVVRRIAERARLDDRGWNMLASQSSAALWAPIEIVRLYPDGREEPVRGYEFSDASLRSLRDIVAATGHHEADFLMSPNGDIGASLRGAPVHISAPSVLVAEMALVPAEGRREVPSPIPHPGSVQ